MQISSINEIKKELKTLSSSELVDLCLKIAKFKSDNKEFFHYQLFESNNKEEYLEKIKLKIDSDIISVDKHNLYLANKSLRKILKGLNKQAKYVNDKPFQIELLIYFCLKIKQSQIKINRSTALQNLYNLQISKIEKLISSLHEDLQFDYNLELQQLID